MVTLLVLFAVVNFISHFSDNASVETPFCLVDEKELIFTCSINDGVKALILEWGLVVGFVVFFQSCMHSG